MEPFFVSLALLVLSSSVLSEINFDLNYDDELKDSLGKKYDIRGTVELRCKVTATENEQFNVKWFKEKKELKWEKVGDKYNVKFTRATEEDAGTYYCVAYNKDGAELDRANITLFSKYRVKTPDNVNVVEGEPLRITCAVHGRPVPTISWKVGNETYEESSDRILLQKDEEKNVDKAIFVIEEVQMSDRGIYTCIGTSEIGTIVMDETMVRIKDKYAALWPFLGICAEVFILCAIILIYEKKRNKAELEESDTDQSPDQKNTPDHGKESNLRHRQ